MRYIVQYQLFPSRVSVLLYRDDRSTQPDTAINSTQTVIPLFHHIFYDFCFSPYASYIIPGLFLLSLFLYCLFVAIVIYSTSKYCFFLLRIFVDIWDHGSEKSD